MLHGGGNITTFSFWMSLCSIYLEGDMHLQRDWQLIVWQQHWRKKIETCLQFSISSRLRHYQDLPFWILWRICKSRNILLFQQKQVRWECVILQAKRVMLRNGRIRTQCKEIHLCFLHHEHSMLMLNELGIKHKKVRLSATLMDLFIIETK